MLLVCVSVASDGGLLNSGPSGSGLSDPGPSGQMFLGPSRAYFIYFLFIFIILLFQISSLFICLYVHFDKCVTIIRQRCTLRRYAF